jgi:hypothetical protein
MSDSQRDHPTDAPLNPALKSEKDTVYDTRHTSPAPIDTTSAREGEGEGWPWIWLIVTVVCVLLAIYFLA